MIIKSLSRKTPSFRQLLEYFNREGDIFEGMTYNAFAGFYDLESVAEEFEDNAELMQRRKNGNYLFHEVISLEENRAISLDRQKEILKELACRYVSKRAKRNLVYAQIHGDTGNLHCHLMISANEVNSRRRHRLSKAKFSAIQKGMEKFKFECFPELGTEKRYTKSQAEKSQIYLSNKEYALKRRTGKLTQKEEVASILEEVVLRSETPAVLSRLLAQEGWKVYQRGKTKIAYGVMRLDTGKKYRLRTLDLSEDFHEAFKKLIALKERQQDLSRIRDRQVMIREEEREMEDGRDAK